MEATMKWKRSVLLILSLCFLLIASSCGDTDKSDSGKIILTFGYTGYSSYDAEISYFNAMQDTYEIQMQHYIPSGDAYVADINGVGSSDECRAQLIEDIKNGNGPDIIDLASFSLSVDDSDVNQYLENLYPYIDQDNELSRDDFIASFLNAYEVDGALYSTANALILNTVAVSASVTEEGTWNIGMLADTAHTVGGAEHLSYVVADSDVLFSKLIDAFIYDFIDSERGYANFDCTAYRDLLKTCGALENQDYTGTETDELAVLYVDQIRSFYYPQLYEACFHNDFTFAGGLDGSVASFWSEPFERLAMNSTSTYKDGIWKFLRIFLTAEYQKTCSVFPTNLSALEDQLQDAQAGNYQKTIQSQFGETLRDYTPITSFDPSNLKYVPVSDEHIQRILELIAATTRISSDEVYRYIGVVRECAKQYFEGEIDLDTAVSMTQEQVSLLMQE
jgi:hypothetical protein